MFYSDPTNVNFRDCEIWFLAGKEMRKESVFIIQFYV
jgi:hypothetical protein